MKLKERITIPRPVAVAIDYRGEQDDCLTFLFRGACWSQLVCAFSFLVGQGRGVAHDATIYLDHDAEARNGKGLWYYAVELMEPNYHFASLDDMKLLIEARLTRHHQCKVKWMSLERFLNT